jgi:hypothetical protein
MLCFQSAAVEEEITGFQMACFDIDSSVVNGLNLEAVTIGGSRGGGNRSVRLISKVWLILELLMSKVWGA